MADSHACACANYKPDAYNTKKQVDRKYDRLTRKMQELIQVSICEMSFENGGYMIEAKYYRDYGHNYMILQCEQQEVARSYQYKILTSGKIEEILKCSVRHINSTTYYYYDISSRATLDSLYHDKKMSYAEVKDILRQIQGICEKLAGHFMEEAGLVLLPEYIYYDFATGKYIGLYYPDYKPEEPNVYKPLTDFLLEHIDTEDQKLTENIYRICEMAEEKYFFIEDALRIMEDEEGVIRQSSDEPQEEQNRELNLAEAETPNFAGDVLMLEQYHEEPAKRNMFYPVFAGLLLVGIIAAVAVRNIYDLTQQEELVLYGAAAVMGVCLFFCLAGYLAGGKKRSVAEEKIGRKTDGESYPDSPTDMTLVPLNRIISRDMNLEMAGCSSQTVRPVRDGDRRFHDAESDGMPENDIYGNTVFFDESAAAEYKLYAVDKRNKKHIELKQFPCTIGKMAGCVDYVLSDDSISRIHARFDMQGEKVLLTDMNSTNGTYKNGLRMQPQETVEIEPGDEVRFGNLNYCYR